jgi:hypothetical protein
MTALETLNTVRMMLDDGKDWYPSLANVLRQINEAQIITIMKYHNLADERFLRTLYVENTGVTDGGIIDINAGDCMYVRSVRLFESAFTTYETSVHAEYIPYALYINENHPSYERGQYFPKNAVWTFRERQDIDGIMKKILYFKIGNTSPDMTANVWYIKYPDTFIVDNFNDVPLQVPAEYHPEICFLAAERINTHDVGEMERGDIAIPGQQRLTLQGAGL